jgi:hypothetical protein
MPAGTVGGGAGVADGFAVGEWWLETGAGAGER